MQELTWHSSRNVKEQVVYFLSIHWCWFRDPNVHQKDTLWIGWGQHERNLSGIRLQNLSCVCALCFSYLFLYFRERAFQKSISSSLEANFGITFASMTGKPEKWNYICKQTLKFLKWKMTILHQMFFLWPWTQTFPSKGKLNIRWPVIDHTKHSGGEKPLSIHTESKTTSNLV